MDRHQLPDLPYRFGWEMIKFAQWHHNLALGWCPSFTSTTQPCSVILVGETSGSVVKECSVSVLSIAAIEHDDIPQGLSSTVLLLFLLSSGHHSLLAGGGLWGMAYDWHWHFNQDLGATSSGWLRRPCAPGQAPRPQSQSTFQCRGERPRVPWRYLVIANAC